MQHHYLICAVIITLVKQADFLGLMLVYEIVHRTLVRIVNAMHVSLVGLFLEYIS